MTTEAARPDPNRWRSSGEKPKSGWMDGRATFTIETSSTTIR